MIRNYVITAFRNLMKHKTYTFINILGLCIGLTASLIIFLYVRSELSYDKFYNNFDKIYRLTVEYNSGGKINEYCNLARPIGPAMKMDYSEIKAMTRISGVNLLNVHKADIKYNEKKYFTDKIFYADSTYFQVFSQYFLKGTAENSLTEPNTIVLTESFAKKIFGNSDPINKSIQYQSRGQWKEARITGIIEDLPENTHLPIEALVSWESQGYGDRFNEVWFGAHVYTYVLLNNPSDKYKIINKFPEFFDKYMKTTFDGLNSTCKLDLQELSRIHLESHLIWEPYSNGNKVNIYIFSIIGIFLLFIAGINYVNLATAGASGRAREVGMRKIFGAHRPSLIYQFLIESILLAILALIISFVSCELFLPWFNNFTSKSLSLFGADTPLLLSLFILVSISLGFLSGLYPGFYISAFSPLKVLKGKIAKGSKNNLLRQFLIIFQFIISVSLIISTIIVIRQFNYVINKDPGFNKENVISLQVKDSIIINNLQSIKAELKNHSGIINIAASSDIPGEELNQTVFNGLNPDGTTNQIGSQFLVIDYDFIDLMEMKIINGRAFDKSFPTDEQSVIINETAFKKLNWSGDISNYMVGFGQDSAGNEIKRTIIGVMSDFQMQSARELIHPIIILPADIPFSNRINLLIKIKANENESVIKFLDEYWRKYNIDTDYTYTFLEDNIANQYAGEQKLIRLFIISVCIMIFIACLGLLGLISFVTSQRKKELSIRKVLGSSPGKNLIIIVKEFLVLVFIANIIAWPITYFLMNKWLLNFAYRIEIGIWEYIIAAILTFTIAIITIIYQTFKAAYSNPADNLRYE
ncbi:MAG: hypothetical protein A2W99_08010 [Bacteroidetes bacterium GWF2_33_16]|nr:MAG: hypothetical protein A2X00_08355 [Bacteroidetes bacterium GWE2_32_14]OFY02234.1 MAG: hypothetical protein A2W99_08010 [Bacteroidetes bacterium GWF2_33_16]